MGVAAVAAQDARWVFLQSSTTANATAPPACKSGTGSKGVYLRHCDFAAFATHLGCHSSTDFSDGSFRIVDALDSGAAGATLSFQSRYAADFYLAAPATTPSGESPRLMLAQNDGTKDFAARATFMMATGPLGEGTTAFTSLAPVGNPARSHPLSLQPSLSGQCAGDYSTAAGEGDVVFLQSSAAATSWVVETVPPYPPAAPVTAVVSPSSVGNFTIPRMASVGIEFLNHEIYGGGLYAQMVFGESFEEVENGASTVQRHAADDPSQWGFIGCQGGRASAGSLTRGVSEMWLAVREGPAAAAGTVSLETGGAFNGDQFQRLRLPSPAAGQTARLGLANFGLNCQLGMQFLASKPYTGSLYLRGEAGAGTVRVFVSAEATEGGSNTILDEAEVSVPADGAWHAASFTLTPLLRAGCGDMADGTTPGRRVTTCIGRFLVTLKADGGSAPQAVDVDMVELLPGPWGLLDAPGGTIGLPARRDVAELFRAEGIQVFRNGGTMCNGEEYRWKRFRGPRDSRQPYHGFWYQQAGLTQSRRFAMFEGIDLCSVIGCDPVITLNNLEAPGDMGDFVEYCWGNSSTEWGRQRVLDGHPAPYNVTFVEIGNEQGLDTALLTTFAAITAAMDARSRAIGAPLFRYAIGHNLNTGELADPAGRNMTARFLDAARPYGDRVVWDFHVGSGEGGPAPLEALLVAFQQLCRERGSAVRVVVFEENGGDHGLLRGVGHGAFSNVFMRHADIGIVHGFADAIQAWQGMDAEQAFPQGQLFFTPNATWLQPPGHVIRMIGESHQPRSLGVALSQPTASQVDVAAVADDEQSVIVLRCANVAGGGGPAPLTLQFRDGWLPQRLANMTVLADTANKGQPDRDAQNTPWAMDAVVPVTTLVDVTGPISLPPTSFSVITVHRRA